MGVSKRLRFEVFRRDNFRCRYCGTAPSHAELRVDHVIPEALGGKTEASNLVAACVDCNSGKSSIAPDSPVVDDVRQDALRWSKALRLGSLRRTGRAAPGHATPPAAAYAVLSPRPSKLQPTYDNGL